MTTINKFFCLHILLLVFACGKKENMDTPISGSNQLSFVTKQLSIKANLLEKEVAFEGRAFHTSLVYNNKMWVMSGQKIGEDANDVWQSEDGLEWELMNPNAAFSARAEHAAVVHDNLMWLVGGRNNGTLYNDVWFSKNGKDWLSTTKAAAFSPRSSHTLSTFKGRMWLIGGQNTLQGNDLNSDVWVSGDGEKWSATTTNAPFGERTNHSALVHDNKLWILGGYGKTHDSANLDFKNDVWYTADGQNWVEATPSASFKPRSGHSSISYNGYMWVVGGYAGKAEFLNDIWRSKDGISWKKIQTDPDFRTRSDHTSVVFKDHFWAIVGHPVISYPTKTGVYTEGYHSDIWSFGK